MNAVIMEDIDMHVDEHDLKVMKDHFTKYSILNISSYSAVIETSFEMLKSSEYEKLIDTPTDK